MRHVDRSEIRLITGSSMGLMCGYSLSAGKLDVFEEVFRSVGINRRLELFRKVLFHRLLPRAVDEIMTPADKLEIPFAFSVCYVPVCTVKYYWLLGEFNPAWKKFVCAALTFPFLCVTPRFLNGKLAVDGGMADNIPLYPMLRCGPQFLAPGEKLDLVLVLHFDAHYDFRAEFVSDTPIVDLDLAICNRFKKNHYDFSRQYVEEMLASAEEYGERICKKLIDEPRDKKEITAAAERIFLDEYAARRRNVSADRLLSLFNHLGKALRSEASCNKILF